MEGLYSQRWISCDTWSSDLQAAYVRSATRKRNKQDSRILADRSIACDGVNGGVRGCGYEVWAVCVRLLGRSRLVVVSGGGICISQAVPTRLKLRYRRGFIVNLWRDEGCQQGPNALQRVEREQ